MVLLKNNNCTKLFSFFKMNFKKIPHSFAFYTGTFLEEMYLTKVEGYFKIYVRKNARYVPQK